MNQDPVGTPSDNTPYNASTLRSISVELQIGNLGNYEVETVPDIQISDSILVPEQGILVAPLLDSLRDTHSQISGCMFSYFSPTRQLFVYLGNDPLAEDVFIPFEDIKDGMISIKCRTKDRIDQLALPLIKQEDSTERLQRGSRRTKERQIGFIIEKVAQWRKLYNGVINDRNETIRLTLEEAASQVGIAKKSLDDYLLQLRFGRKYGFNFHEHRFEKVGLLRAYVKKYKDIEKKIKELKKDREPPADLIEALKMPGTASCKDTYCCKPAPESFMVPPHVARLL